MDVFLQQLVNGLSLGAIFALVAVGYTMVYGILRLINFAHGEVFMVGAMTAYFVAINWQAPSRDNPVDYVARWAAHARVWLWVAAALLVTAGLLQLAAAVRRATRGGSGGGWLWTPVSVAVPLALAGALVWGHLRYPGETAVWFAFGVILVASMALAAAVGLLIEFLAYRPLRNQPRINSLITAIGVSLFLQYAGQKIFFGPDPKTYPEVIVPRLLPGSDAHRETLLPWDARTVLRFNDDAPKAAPAPGATRVELAGPIIHVRWTSHSTGAPVERGVTVKAMLLLILLLTLVLMVVLRHVVMHTRTGLGLRAVSHRFDTAALMGVNVNRSVSFTFLLGSALAGAGGFLFAATGAQITPLMGRELGLTAFVAAVIGGIGNIPGAVAGGFLVGIARSLVSGFLPNGSRYETAIVYLILIVVLMARPAGLFGRNTTEKV